MSERLIPRAVYFGDEPSRHYFELNSEYVKPQDLLVGGKRLIISESVVDRSAYDLNANTEGLDSRVKVIALPVCIPARLSKGTIKEMRNLREKSLLTELRGGRKTDLARPLRKEVIEAVLQECPNLVELVARVESSIQGGK